VNLSALEAAYKNGEMVSPASLTAKGLVRRAKGRPPAVKILGSGPVGRAFLIKGCAISVAARKALLAAGGTIHA
jgi:ribosomal protein L15